MDMKNSYVTGLQHTTDHRKRLVDRAVYKLTTMGLMDEAQAVADLINDHYKLQDAIYSLSPVAE